MMPMRTTSSGSDRTDMVDRVSLFAEVVQGAWVGEANLAAAADLDEALGDQVGEGARDGLDGEAEVVGDVLARERQLEGLAGVGARGEVHEEARHPLARGAAAEGEHEILAALQ